MRNQQAAPFGPWPHVRGWGFLFCFVFLLLENVASLSFSFGLVGTLRNFKVLEVLLKTLLSYVCKEETGVCVFFYWFYFLVCWGHVRYNDWPL